jgi:hypothetical protein
MRAPSPDLRALHPPSRAKQRPSSGRRPADCPTRLRQQATAEHARAEVQVAAAPRAEERHVQQQRAPQAFVPTRVVPQPSGPRAERVVRAEPVSSVVLAAAPVAFATRELQQPPARQPIDRVMVARAVVPLASARRPHRASAAALQAALRSEVAEPRSVMECCSASRTTAHRWRRCDRRQRHRPTDSRPLPKTSSDRCRGWLGMPSFRRSQQSSWPSRTPPRVRMRIPARSPPVEHLSSPTTEDRRSRLPKPTTVGRASYGFRACFGLPDGGIEPQSVSR